MKYKTRSEELKAVIIEFKKSNTMNSLLVRMRNDGHTITAPTIKRWLDGKRQSGKVNRCCLLKG